MLLFKNKIFLLLAAMALLTGSCASDDDTPNPDPGPVNGGDISDQVSQYEARAFDGVKRAGVFYEIYVRSFADSDGNGIGDLKGVTAKLDYLDDLGVGGIWLMPVYKCNSEHGYDVIDYMTVNPDYGTNADLEELITQAHRRNIRVILDFVPNHMSDRSMWFSEACKSVDNSHRGFFHFETAEKASSCLGWYPVKSGTTSYYYQGAFDKSMPDLNYGPAATCQASATFRAMTDAAKFWIDKGVDGFRLDAVKHVYDSETSDENPTFLKKFYDNVNAYFQGKSALGDPNVYMVGECWMGTEQMAPYYRGIPALFDFTAWADRLLYAIQHSHAKWFPKDMIEEREIFARYRADFIQATKLSNHDEVRARTSLGGTLAESLERAKMAAAVLLTSVGSPYIYYGEEIGMIGDKTQSGGDRNVREPMLWAPKAEDSFRTSWIPSANSYDINVGNVATQAKDVRSLYNVYRKFLRLRNTYPALAAGTISLPENFDDTKSDDKQVMAFYRTEGSEKLLVLHNVSPAQSTYTINHAIDRPVADMNKVTVTTKSPTEHVVTMPAYSSIIIQL